MDGQSTKMLNLCCIGNERVGCLTMLVMAKNCSNVCITIVDEDDELIKKRAEGEFPFYEPGVTDLFQEVYNLQPPRLIFSSDVVESLTNADFIFIAIDIKSTKNFEGLEELDLEEWLSSWKCLKSIPGSIILNKIIVDLSSTPPLEFEEHLKDILGDLSRYSIVFSPSFMSQGTSIRDLEKPSQVVIASRKPDAGNAVRDLYAQWVDEDKISVIDSIGSAILGKLGLNVSLAMQINVINGLYSDCMEYGADFDEVLTVVFMGKNCGNRKDYFNPGVGFGGPNLEKDLNYLASTAKLGGHHEQSIVFNKIVKDNEKTRKRFVEKVVCNMGGTRGKKIAVLGVAFKKDTDCIVNSPAIEICKELVKEEGAEVMIYDPQAKIDCVRSCFKGAREKVKVLTDPYEACVGAHAICVLTDWTEFSNLDFVRIFNCMQDKGYAHLFFGRRMKMLLPQLVDLGFKVHGI